MFGLLLYCEVPYDLLWGRPTTNWGDLNPIWQLGHFVHSFTAVCDNNNLTAVPAVECLIDEGSVIVDIYRYDVGVFQHTKRIVRCRDENDFVFL